MFEGGGCAVVLHLRVQDDAAATVRARVPDVDAPRGYARYGTVAALNLGGSQSGGEWKAIAGDEAESWVEIEDGNRKKHCENAHRCYDNDCEEDNQ